MSLFGLLIVIYSVRTRSVTVVVAVVFAILPLAVVVPVPVVTVAVSVPVTVSFTVFIFVAVVAVRFFSVGRFAVSFAAGVGYGFFRQIFLVAVSVAFLFLLFQGSIETGNAVLPQDIRASRLGGCGLVSASSVTGFIPFLFMLITSKARLAEIVTKLAANDLSVE